MSKPCRACQQLTATEAELCTACQDAATKVASAPDRPSSSPEIDLGQPVFGTSDSGPPSGASFTSWADRLQRKAKPATAEAATSAPAATAAPTADDGENSAVIDLGSPVTNAVGPNGPPSGASFVAWASLLPRRQLGDAPATLPERGVALPLAPDAVAPDQRNAERLGWLLAGVALGVALAAALWLAGFEPPQSLRRAPAQTAPVHTP